MRAVVDGKLKPGDTELDAGRTGQTQARQRQPISAWAALHLQPGQTSTSFDFLEIALAGSSEGWIAAAGQWFGVYGESNERGIENSLRPRLGLWAVRSGSPHPASSLTALSGTEVEIKSAKTFRLR